MGKTYYISNYNFLIEHRSSSGFLPFPILALQMYILPNTYLPGFYGIGLYYFSFSILLFSSLGFFVFQLFSLYIFYYIPSINSLFFLYFFGLYVWVYTGICVVVVFYSLVFPIKWLQFFSPWVSLFCYHLLFHLISLQEICIQFFQIFSSFKYGVLLLLLQHHLLFCSPPEGDFSFPFYSIAIPTK